MSWTQRILPETINPSNLVVSNTRIIVAPQEYIWISYDLGLTWIPALNNISRAWGRVCISDDGSFMAAYETTNIWISSDSGKSWTIKNSTQTWGCLSCSSTGQYILAGGSLGNLQLSTDYGETWSQVVGDAYWKGTTVSTDGQKLLAIESNVVFYSLNGGANWNTTPPFANFNQLTASADGQLAYATVYGGGVFKSSDYGVSWAAIYGGGLWTDITTSSDGQTVLFSYYNNYIYRSQDGGATIDILSTLGINTWLHVTSSRDAQYSVASYAGSTIFWVYGHGYLPLQSLSLDTSYLHLPSVFLSNTICLPPIPSVPEGKLITFINPNSNSIYTINDPISTPMIHLNTQNSWATFVAGSTTWLRLGASELGGIQDFSIQSLNASTINTQVNTTIALFPSFTSSLTSTLSFTADSGTIQSLQPSSLYFSSAPTLPLILSTNSLVYNDTVYGGSVSGEILQFL